MSEYSERRDQIIVLGEILEELDFKVSFEDRQAHIRNMLARYLNLGTVVALVGAGASIPLGYPSWTRFAKDALTKSKELIQNPKHLEVIDRYWEYLDKERGNELSAQVMLETCEGFWESSIREHPVAAGGESLQNFRDYIGRYFDERHRKFPEPVEVRQGQWVTPDRKRSKEHNPYLALLELPIRRFITTNYDLEIERALLMKREDSYQWQDGREGDASAEDIIKWSKGRSFSQDSKFCAEMAKFPLARYDDNRGMVFHCHGRIPDIKSCIVTEKDYQKWYLTDRHEYLPFRQTLDLTLSSNPILIIGYGLGDADLMRWLRTITANRSADRSRNPLFCINYFTQGLFEGRWGGDRELIEAECDALYMKYGLHVIPIYENADGDPGRKPHTLCDELAALAKRWDDWWDGLLLKPKFRRTPKENFREASYYHYEIDFDKSAPDIPSIHGKLTVKLDKLLGLGEYERQGGADVEGARRPGLAVVVGDGGTGKSWSVQRYLKEKQEEYARRGKHGEFVFWSSYYANDVLTGIDRVIEFLSRHQKDKPDLGGEVNEAAEDRFEKLIRLLRVREQSGQQMLIVFDGIEKLLTPDRAKTDGRSISPEVKKFFRIIEENYTQGGTAADGFSCKIILTTRLFPLDLLPAPKPGTRAADNQEAQQHRRKEIEIVATRCWKEDLLGNAAGAKVEESNVELPGVDTFLNLWPADESRRKVKTSSLCSLVNGHVFCVALIRGILEGAEAARGQSAEEELERLERDIANTPIDRRVYRVIREAIEKLDAGRTYHGRGQLVQKFIERISLFMHPVSRDVAKVCLRDAEYKVRAERAGEAEAEKGAQEEPDEELEATLDKELKELLDLLVEKNLLQVVFLKVETEEHEAESGYVVHPLVRNFVHQTLHKSLFTSLPSLQLSGITTMEVVDPGAPESGVAVTRSLFERLCAEARAPFPLPGRSNDAQPHERAEELAQRRKTAPDLCRGAFSILRSRFCANTVTRWGNYKDYLKLVVKLYDTAKIVSGEELWRHHEPTPGGIESTRSETAMAPLYSDEVAWVYNEIGLTSISNGHVLNAIPFREQGLEISRLIDNDRDGRYLFQAEFNLSTAYTLLGRLSYAIEYLKRAYVIGNRLHDDELVSRTSAYMAYIKYLQGSLEEADRDFNASYTKLENNPRARGVFYCYHGELLLKLGRPDEARVKIDQSRHIGEAELYPDLVAYARLAEANLLVKRGEYDKAQNEYAFVLKEARRTRLRRLETGTLSGMSRLACKLNDSEVAKQRAIESLKISNEYALCLHQTIGLIVLGKALLKEGRQRDLGIACLKTASSIANSQGYFLRKNEADQALQELKVE